jgi:hypothetical protein
MLTGEGNRRVAIVVSEESKDYRPEMEWAATRIADCGLRIVNCQVGVPEDLEYRAGGVYLDSQRVDLVYRFFELFDLPNIAGAEKLIAATRAGQVRVTPPFKPQLEEKLWLALFWFPQLADFWRRELGDRYFRDLQTVIPFTWILDPSPLPPHAVIPHLNIQDWKQLGDFSQKQRELILKISGFSERAWGARGVMVGNDLPSGEWKSAVTRALEEFETHPHILQRFEKTRLVEHSYYDFDRDALASMKGRVRLCPYYFTGGGKAELYGILATICPADKKLIHGMSDAILTLAH